MISVKKLFSVTLLFGLLAVITPPNAVAATLTTCGGGGASNRLDPPANPNGDLGSGMNFSEVVIPNVKASKANSTTAYASWGDWGSGGLVTFFMYASSDNGATWKCTRSYARSAQIDGLTPGVEFIVAVMARVGDTWAKPVIVRVPAVAAANQKCSPEGYYLDAEYIAALNSFKLVVTSNAYKNDSVYMLYSFEASIDNWKTKTIARGGNSRQSPTLFMSPFLAWIKPMSKTAIHQFRAIPAINTSLAPSDESGNSIYTTQGCPNLTASAGFTEKKKDPCVLNPAADGCETPIVAGENADATTLIPTPSPTISKKPAAKSTSINCYLGKSKAVITGVNPKCPTGWKKK